MRNWRDRLPEELDFMRAGRLPQKSSNESMTGKVCLITGATSGVGYVTALRLAEAGAEIVFIARSKEKAEQLSRELQELTGTPPVYYLADFTDLEQVRKTAHAILGEHPKIDVLINNAGVHMTTRQLTTEGHETAFCVNHLASFTMTVLLLKRMVDSAPSRILQVNSEGHRFNGLRLDDLNWERRPYRGLKGYGASKTAQLMTVWELNELLSGSGVSINAVHPGAVKSNIGHNNGWMYNAYSKGLIQPLLKKTEISGEAIYYLASSKEMDHVSGKFFNLTNEEIPAKHARDRKLGKELFQKTKELTGLENQKYYEI